MCCTAGLRALLIQKSIKLFVVSLCTSSSLRALLIQKSIKQAELIAQAETMFESFVNSEEYQTY